MLSAVSFDEYESLLLALQETLGVVVPEARRGQLLERLQVVMDAFDLASISALAQALQQTTATDALRAQVLDVISRPQTDWAMPAEIATVLRKYAFAQLTENARVWLLGCGQGQGAYTLAMELADYEQSCGDSKELRILATEAVASDIRQAEAGLYSHEEMAGLRELWREAYTVPEAGDGRRIKDKIRQRVEFSQCDLLQDFQSLGAMDMIVCPSILVYFSNGAKASILQQLASLLKPGGIFLAGLNQAILPFNQDFERVEHPSGVFYRRKA